MVESKFAAMKDSEPPLAGVNFLDGAVLLVDKPQGWTSFDVVAKLRSKLRKVYQVKKLKVGHAGTLDPMATGLLIICTGKETKRISDYQDQSKYYTGTMRFGATTPSYDADAEIDAHYPTDHLHPDLIKAALPAFTGPIMQRPPMFSAIKVDGQPLYKKARKGEIIEVQPRPVQVYAFELTHIALPEVDFAVHCSKGTYIRSLVHDLGRSLESGAFLTALRRTAIGDFSVEQAWTVPQLMTALDRTAWLEEE